MDIFDKIIKGEIPSKKLFENEYCIVILDISPIRKGHALVISKESKAKVEDLSASTIQNMMLVARSLSKKMCKEINASATNIMINNGKDAGQEVPHVHIHVIPRKESDRALVISEKQHYEEGEIEKFASLLALSESDLF